MGRIEDLLETTQILYQSCPGEELVTLKTDFKSAYRCVLIRPSRKEFAHSREELAQLVVAT